MIIRPQSLIFSFRGRVHPFISTPTFKQIQETPRETWAEQLSQPSVRSLILGEVEELMSLSESGSIETCVARRGRHLIKFSAPRRDKTRPCPAYPRLPNADSLRETRPGHTREQTRGEGLQPIIGSRRH